VALGLATGSPAPAGAHRSGSVSARVERSASAPNKIDPAVCAGCAPPLHYAGGPVMATHAKRGLLVVPIYWLPRGDREGFPPGFESTVDRFIADVAAASGRKDNVFSVATEYYSDLSGAPEYEPYAIRAGPRVIDTDAFPPSAGDFQSKGCQPAGGYTECISDRQLQAEIKRVVQRRRLRSGLARFYPVFLPPGVETTGSDGSNSLYDFCAYHGAFRSGDTDIVYSNQPYNQINCSPAQAPNGNLPADSVISVLSHELIEAMTDPLNPPRSWEDKTGNEVADMCANTYGRALGSTSRSDSAGTQYNQVINGGRYYLPQEFSNFAFDEFGPDRGCVLSEKAAHSATAAATGSHSLSPQTFVVDATRNTLPADGTATSTIEVISSNAAGDALSGDHIHLTVSAQAGYGRCGTLSRTDTTTGGGGRAEVTYTASKGDVSCWVLAVDAAGGRSGAAVIYQGATRADSPAIRATFPRSLRAGGPPATFDLTLVASEHPILGTLTHIVIAAATPGAARVDADQVHLSYRPRGGQGAYIPVPLVGSTSTGNVIEGYIGALRGHTLAKTERLTLRLALERSVPASRAGPLLALQANLDQTNSASGSDAALANSQATPLTVPDSTGSHSTRNILIACALALGLAFLAFLGLQRRRSRRAPRSAA
jgi:hypothetical protein